MPQNLRSSLWRLWLYNGDFQFVRGLIFQIETLSIGQLLCKKKALLKDEGIRIIKCSLKKHQGHQDQPLSITDAYVLQDVDNKNVTDAEILN